MQISKEQNLCLKTVCDLAVLKSQLLTEITEKESVNLPMPSGIDLLRFKRVCELRKQLNDVIKELDRRKGN
ncbi:hypothetical protein FUAX_55990 (plasmid) [Fulvitalea axinellae]|uniref:50S ribosomal protein L29 n=1 Tax=Fulvitalea axinellae TaxID=1182444 RepID=A0AAU9CZJ7_9BACT|nr:hypothetical protein FUAX_55990 [Fulvitalea axinellae]